MAWRSQGAARQPGLFCWAGTERACCCCRRCCSTERLDGGLSALETLGLVLGRALYEGVLLDCPLAPFFVSRLQVRVVGVRGEDGVACGCGCGWAPASPAKEVLRCGIRHSRLCSLVISCVRPACLSGWLGVQGRWPLFEELQGLDPEVYRSLLQLKRYEGQVADLCLDFAGARTTCHAVLRLPRRALRWPPSLPPFCSCRLSLPAARHLFVRHCQLPAST